MNPLNIQTAAGKIARAMRPPKDTPHPCLALQGFGVGFDEDLEADNFEKTKIYNNKDYFYSQEWEDSGYNSANLCLSWPFLLMLPPNESWCIKNRFVDKEYFELTFKVLDRMYGDYSEECLPCIEGDYCSNRTWEQQLQDTRNILKSFLEQLINFDFGACFPGITDDACKNMGLASDTKIQITTLNNYTTKCLVGTFARLRIWTHSECESFEYDFDKPRPPVTDQEGCADC